MNRTVLISAGMLAIAACGALAVKPVRQPPAYCDVCVMQRETTEWRFAGHWKMFESSRLAVTPITELLEHHAAAPAHQHRWSVPRYVPESELETADAPRVLSVGLLNEPRVVNFLESVFAYTDAANVECWRKLAWRLEYASALEPALRFNRFPENGFTTRTEFLAWWNQHAYPLFNRLNQVTEAD